MRCLRLSALTQSELLRRISVDAQISKLRGELALLSNPYRDSPEALSATLARMRRHIEIAERNLAAHSG